MERPQGFHEGGWVIFFQSFMLTKRAKSSRVGGEEVVDEELFGKNLEKRKKRLRHSWCTKMVKGKGTVSGGMTGVSGSTISNIPGSK